jgi:putative hydrolase of the HAD superfamily
MNALKVILLDAWGTLFDDRGYFGAEVEMARGFLEECGGEVSPDLLVKERLRAWEEHLRHLGGDGDFEKAVLQSLTEVFRRLKVPGDPGEYLRRAGEIPILVFPEVPQALERLPGPKGVLSDTPRIWLDEYLKGNNIAHHFTYVFTPDVLGAFKPDPQAFRAALDLLRLPPDKVLYVGDSPKDLAAEAVGIPVVWLNRYERPLPPGTPLPTQEIKTLGELADRLGGEAG